jgi:hypothetical protein
MWSKWIYWPFYWFIRIDVSRENHREVRMDRVTCGECIEMRVIFAFGNAVVGRRKLTCHGSEARKEVGKGKAAQICNWPSHYPSVRGRPALGPAPDER